MLECQNADDRSVTIDDDSNRPYREISGWAVAGVCGGVLSALALANEVFWLIPPAAVAINLVALRQIREQAQSIVGRRAALAGLALALIFGLSAPLQGPIHYRGLRAQAIDTARQWFVALRENKPHLAHQLALPQWVRMPADESLTGRYAEETSRRALQNYVDQPAVDLLLKLGKRARIRYFSNRSVSSEDETETVVDLYAVTIDQRGRRTSFFVELTLTRRLDLLRKIWSWQVSTAKFLSAAPEQLASAR